MGAVGKACLFVLIALCLGFSFPHANTHNWDDFFPFGAHGVFAGASVIYFSYGGYNACTNFAEEVSAGACLSSSASAQGFFRCFPVPSAAIHIVLGWQCNVLHDLQKTRLEHDKRIEQLLA